MLELRKPADGGLGFTLVQGEKGPASALFVRSIAPGGVAHADGRLKVGDKLLQVCLLTFVTTVHHVYGLTLYVMGKIILPIFGVRVDVLSHMANV